MSNPIKKRYLNVNKNHSLETVLKITPILLAVFYLQGIFYYIGMLNSYGVSESLYSLQFHQSFYWTVAFYLSEIGIYLLLIELTFLLAIPYLPSIINYLSYGVHHSFKIPVRIFTSSVSIWLFSLFVIFNTPYTQGQQDALKQLAVQKCMMTDEEGYKFKGSDQLIVKSNTELKTTKYENVWILHMSDKFYTLFDGKDVVNIPVTQIVSDKTQVNIFNNKKSEKRVECERQVKENQ